VRGARLACGLLAQLLSLIGCSTPPTRIVALVEAEPSLEAELEIVRFVVDARAMGGDLHTQEVSLTAGRLSLPLVLPLVHDGGPLGPLRVEVLALGGGNALALARARLSFVRERSMTLRLTLSALCAPAATPCGEEERCVAGACAPLDVDEHEQFEWSGLPAPAASDGGAASDAGTGSCAEGCECIQACTSGCECRGACACALECPAGEDCTAVRCNDTSSCAVQAAGASNLAVRCEGDASCVIDARGASNATLLDCRDRTVCEADCAGTSNCAMRCASGARCLLACASSGNCDLECSGVQRDCGDGVIVCNRECP
jgi:hypothetical protein